MSNKSFTPLPLLGLLLSSASVAGVTKPYLMAVHTCDTSAGPSGYCDPPSTHQTRFLESSDGTTWTMISGFPTPWSGSAVTNNGSVPDLVVRGTNVYVYNPGSVHRINRSSGLVVSADPVTITDSSGNPVSFVDPSPILDPITNKIVLFYLDTTGLTSNPASCGTASSCTKYIRSATEQGSQGKRFLQDPGYRVAISLSGSTDPIGPVASDPDVFSDTNGYVLLVSRGAKTQAFTSSTLTGTFSTIGSLSDSVLIDGSSLSGVSAGYYDPVSMQYWFYAHDGSTVPSIRRATTSSLASVLRDSDFSTVATAVLFGLDATQVMVASPGFTKDAP